MALRMLKRSMLAIGGEAPQETQISLAKLERLLKHLRMAIRDQRPLPANAGLVGHRHGGGYLEVRTAPPRRSQREAARGQGGRSI